jgi:hypothetical protein
VYRIRPPVLWANFTPPVGRMGQLVPHIYLPDSGVKWSMAALPRLK